VVFLDDDALAAAARRARLDERAGSEYRSDALIFTGTPAQLADVLQGWHQAGISGFRLRPAAIPRDLTAITRGLVPELQRRGAFRRAYDPGTLRARLGLPRPVNRYAVQVSSAANEEHQ
jgi:alkanesulfonate monooxygenase SsuD/methylene tetrahydromethanopterin reductase-like flavin-dependent oxidoreductase (luciferase family)